MEYNYGPTLGDVLRDLWRARIAVFLGAIFGFILAAGIIATAIPKYKATMLVSPTTRSGGMPDMSSLLPDSSGIALDYMVRSFAPSDSSEFTRFEQIVRAPSVASYLMKDQLIPAGISKDRSFRFFNEKKPGDAVALADYLQKHVKIKPVGATSMRKLVYLHADPAFAVGLLQKMHAVADNMIRGDARAKVERRVAYLNQALESAKNSEHRKVLTSLLMEQEHINMILAMEEDFAATIIEPPSASVKPYWPRKGLLMAVFILSGALLGYVLSFMRSSED